MLQNSGQRRYEGKFYYFGPWDAPESAEARFQLWEKAGRPAEVPKLFNLASEGSGAKSPKRRKGFPLWAHPNGQWAKKIGGKVHYFGPWDAPDQALDEYHALLRKLHDPIEEGTPLELENLVNLFLNAKKLAVPREMTDRTWGEYKATGEQLISILGRGFRVDKLSPNDFGRVRAEMAKGIAPTTLFSRIGRARAIFNWAYKTELIKAPRVRKRCQEPMFSLGHRLPYGCRFRSSRRSWWRCTETGSTSIFTDTIT